MKRVAATLASLALIASLAQAQETNVMSKSKSVLSREDVRTVTPALDKYRQDRLLGDVWKRPGLSPRDRSIVTVAALIARNQTVEISRRSCCGLHCILEISHRQCVRRLDHSLVD